MITVPLSFTRKLSITRSRPFDDLHRKSWGRSTMFGYARVTIWWLGPLFAIAQPYNR